MGKAIVYVISICAIFGIIVWAFGVDKAVINWIAGRYGTKCYAESQENQNIKYPIKFNSYQECLNFISK